MLLFWDIDGTLLTTARSGIHAWEGALHDLTGVRADLAAFDTAGRPDFQIARRLLEEFAGADPAIAPVERLVRRYEDLLPAALTRRQGRVLPNVREILEHLSGHSGAHSLLLTGNTRRGAAAKLAHYGLADFFRDGAFSDGPGDRDAIARTAMAQARAAGWETNGTAIVIGDTPHDVRSGRVVGARTIAVATGSYGVAELLAEGPWRVVEQLPPPDAFVRLLRGAEVPSDA